MKQQTELSETGFFLQYENDFPVNGHLPDRSTDYYLRLIWIIFTFVSLISVLTSGTFQNRTMAGILLWYVVTACTVNISTTANRLHLFLPILLSFTSSLLCLTKSFPEKYQECSKAAIYLLILIQIALKLPADITMMHTALHIEEDPGSILLYRDPDLIIPEKEKFRTCCDQNIHTKAVDSSKMITTNAFFNTIDEKSISSIELLLENHFGLVFRKVQS